MRPQAHEMDIRNYPFTVELSTRYGDTDVLRHVNNVAIARLFEEARVRFGMHFRGRSFNEMGELGATVTVSVLVNYLGEVFYPDPVTVGVAVDHIGNSSYSLSCLMTQSGKAVAHNRTVLVQYADGSSTPLPPDVTVALENFRIQAQR